MAVSPPGRVRKPYLSVVYQPDEKPLELLQNILKAMADILTSTERQKSPRQGELARANVTERVL